MNLSRKDILNRILYSQRIQYAKIGEFEEIPLKWDHVPTPKKWGKLPSHYTANINKKNHVEMLVAFTGQRPYDYHGVTIPNINNFLGIGENRLSMHPHPIKKGKYYVKLSHDDIENPVHLPESIDLGKLMRENVGNFDFRPNEMIPEDFYL